MFLLDISNLIKIVRDYMNLKVKQKREDELGLVGVTDGIRN